MEFEKRFWFLVYYFWFMVLLTQVFLLSFHPFHLLLINIGRIFYQSKTLPLSRPKRLNVKEIRSQSGNYISIKKASLKTICFSNNTLFIINMFTRCNSQKPTRYTIARHRGLHQAVLLFFERRDPNECGGQAYTTGRPCGRIWLHQTLL